MKLLLIMLFYVNSLFSQVNVSISLDSEIESISKKQLSNLYLKKIDEIDGNKIVTIDTKENYAEFCRKILNKTPSQVHAYWMKQVFLGKKVPPKKFLSEQVSEIIKNSKNTIGYSSEKIEGRVIYETD